jgi:hypothetical protein
VLNNVPTSKVESSSTTSCEFAIAYVHQVVRRVLLNLSNLQQCEIILAWLLNSHWVVESKAKSCAQASAVVIYTVHKLGLDVSLHLLQQELMSMLQAAILMYVAAIYFFSFATYCAPSPLDNVPLGQ